MTETIDRADDLVDEASIQDGRAIVRFTRTEAALADLRTKYKDATYDLTTTSGDTAARQARKTLVTLRTGLDKRRKELKAPATEFSRKIDSEAARLTAEIVALEDPIDLQIKADEQRREDERIARIRAEEERQAAQRRRIADITEVAVRAAGLPSAEIAEKIALVTRLTIGDDYEEFTAAAINAKAETILGLQALHAAVLQAESLDAENERNRRRLVELEAKSAARQQREEAARIEREAVQEAQREAEQKAMRRRQAQSDAARALADEIRVLQRRAVTSSAAGMLELVTLIEAIFIGDELGDFAGLAQKAKDEALADLHELHSARVHAELVFERQRLELAAARAESERLAALAEEQSAKIAAMDASQAGPVSDGSQTPDGDVLDCSTAPAKAGQDAQESALAGDARPCTDPVAEAAQATAVGDEGKAAHAEERAAEPATLNLGTIAKRMGFELRQTFIDGILLIPHADQDKRAVLWRESQWPQIKAALVRHIEALA